MILVSESEFREELERLLYNMSWGHDYNSVTGPGRSGAVAAVYVSHMTGVPFIPFGQPCPDKLRPILIVDTATKSGKTLKKACNKYRGAEMVATAVYSEENVRYKFWYERDKK